MELDDLDQQLEITFGNIHPTQYGQIKKYITSKLTELGARLLQQMMVDVEMVDYPTATLLKIIYKELKELQDK